MTIEQQGVKKIEELQALMKDQTNKFESEQALALNGIREIDDPEEQKRLNDILNKSKKLFASKDSKGLEKLIKEVGLNS